MTSVAALFTAAVPCVPGGGRRKKRSSTTTQLHVDLSQAVSDDEDGDEEDVTHAPGNPNPKHKPVSKQVCRQKLCK